MLPVELFDAEKPARASKSQDPDVGRNFDSTKFARYLHPNSKARQHSPGAFLIPGQVVSPHQKTEVEAAGIEPASRDISTMASTCVVDYLSFARCTVHRQTEQPTRRERFLTVNVLDVLHSDLELVTSIQGSPAKPISRGYRFS